MGRMQLAYLVLEVRRPDRWRQFADTVFGPTEPAVNPDGSIGLRFDPAAQRLVLTEGRSDDLAAIGLELADDAALDDVTARLAAAGIPTTPGDGALCRARRLQRLVACVDPAGNRVELAVGLERVATPAAPAFPAGFRTGEGLGIGHVVLAKGALATMEAFYCGPLGFRVTERIDAPLGPTRLRGTFLHCNPRHHSIALFEFPTRKRMHHFMLQANDVADVGLAHGRALRAKIPMSLGIGQHPAPDGTISFYGQTPSGFDFEIGAGGREIEPAGWREQPIDLARGWGHRPTARLKLRVARDTLAARLGL
ncbi:MAG: VOC family protein [Alphaproteobacteria bacterium]|nr:VOC family protein [Alphaproteobacteria bacterium]